MRWWRNSVRTWSGPMFPMLIMQLVLSVGMVSANGVGLIIREFDVWRMVFLIAFGSLLMWQLATLVSVMRLRATERRLLAEAGQDGAGSPV